MEWLSDDFFFADYFWGVIVCAKRFYDKLYNNDKNWIWKSHTKNKFDIVEMILWCIIFHEVKNLIFDRKIGIIKGKKAGEGEKWKVYWSLVRVVSARWLKKPHWH